MAALQIITRSFWFLNDTFVISVVSVIFLYIGSAFKVIKPIEKPVDSLLLIRNFCFLFLPNLKLKIRYYFDILLNLNKGKK